MVFRTVLWLLLGVMLMNENRQKPPVTICFAPLCPAYELRIRSLGELSGLECSAEKEMSTINNEQHDYVPGPP